MKRRSFLSMPLMGAWPLMQTHTHAQTIASPQPKDNLAARADVREWAQAVAQRRDWQADELISTLGQAIYQSSVARAILPTQSAETSKDWRRYRASLIQPVRIRAGIEFMRQYKEWLMQIETDTGVPAWLVLGILGVETLFGQRTGSYKTLDALSTLAFNFPASPRDRSAYFKTELEEFFALSLRMRIPATAWKGSYAGALGIPQFMPSSWNKFAVDADRDGRVDLMNSVPDALASVANFMVLHGWVKGQPTHFPVTPPTNPEALTTLLRPDIQPSFTPLHLIALGVELSPAAQNYPGLLALIELKNTHAPSVYVLGTQNFYTVTRYNWSSAYAMSVIELGQLIAEAGKA